MGARPRRGAEGGGAGEAGGGRALKRGAVLGRPDVAVAGGRLGRREEAHAVGLSGGGRRRGGLVVLRREAWVGVEGHIDGVVGQHEVGHLRGEVEEAVEVVEVEAEAVDEVDEVAVEVVDEVDEVVQAVVGVGVVLSMRVEGAGRGRGWCDGTAAGIRVREGEGCGGREVVGGWGYAGGGAAQ